MRIDRSAALIAIGAFACVSLPAGVGPAGERAVIVTLGLSVRVGSGTGVSDAGGTGEAVDVDAVADSARTTVNGVGDGSANGVLVGRLDCIGPQAAAMMQITTKRKKRLRTASLSNSNLEAERAPITFHASRLPSPRSGGGFTLHRT